MSIITANLRLHSPFHIRKNFFLYSILLLAASYYIFRGLTHNIITENLYFPELDGTLFFSMYFLGIYIARIHMDILTKPFSVCMPGHLSIPLKIIFLVGIITTVIFSIPNFIIYPEGLNSLVKIATVFFHGLSIFLLGSHAGSRTEADFQKYMIVGMILIVFFHITADMFWQFIGTSRESFIIFYSVPLVCSTVILTIVLRKSLGKTDFLKNQFINRCSGHIITISCFQKNTGNISVGCVTLCVL